MGRSEFRDVAARFPVFRAYMLAWSKLPAPFTPLGSSPFWFGPCVKALASPAPPSLSPHPAARAAPTGLSSQPSDSSPQSLVPSYSILSLHLERDRREIWPPIPEKTSLPARVSGWGRGGGRWRREEAQRPSLHVPCPAVSPNQQPSTLQSPCLREAKFESYIISSAAVFPA